MRTYGLLAVAAIVGLAGCQPAETPQQMQARMDKESAELTSAGNAVIARWEAWTSAGQADSFPTVFTEQGRELPPNGKAAVGRDAIRQMHAQLASMGTFADQISQESAVANGPLGVSRGTYTSTFTPAKGVNAMGIPPADTGKWVLHWQKADGTWQIADLIYNSDLPIAMPGMSTKAPAATTGTRRR